MQVGRPPNFRGGRARAGRTSNREDRDYDIDFTKLFPLVSFCQNAPLGSFPRKRRPRAIRALMRVSRSQLVSFCQRCLLRSSPSLGPPFGGAKCCSVRCHFSLPMRTITTR